jgi:hypothetical protein
MLARRGHGERWQRQRPSRPARLEVDELQLASHALHLLAQPQDSFVEVDVFPADAQSLALPQSQPERDDIEGFKAIAATGSDE